MEAARSEVWNRGLALGNLAAALRPELVDTQVDHKVAADKIRKLFEYDDLISENPPQVPRLFKSCQEKHPGLCSSHDAFNFVIEVVEQFQKNLEFHKIKLPALCCVEFSVGGSSSSAASSSSSRPSVFKTFYLIGCVARRPLCHVMSALVSFPAVEGGLAFQSCDKNMCIMLCTFYSVVVASVDQTSKLGASYQDLIFKCSVHDFQAESFSEHPNLVILKRPLAEFWLGKDCTPVCNKTSRGDKEKVVLPFGLESAHIEKPKKRAPPSTFDCDPKPRKKPAVEQKTKTGTGTKNETEDAGFDDEEDLYMSPEQVEQLKLAMREVAGSLEDDAMIKEQQLTGPEPEQEPNQPRPRHQPAFFNTRVGIISLKVARRLMKCYFCSNEICKQSLRFEYAYSVSKPQRSIHVECVGQIATNSEALKSSISWLQRELAIDQPMTMQRTALTEALHSLQCIDAAN